MKLAQIIIAALAFITGMNAAWYWYCASRVTADPGWGRNGVVESGVHSAAQDGWIAALIQSSVESTRLNQIAAKCTAASVGLTAIAAILGVLAPPSS